MKNAITLGLIIILGSFLSQTAFAQNPCPGCVIDSTCISGDPNSGTVCPDAIADTAGTDLDTSITFFHPTGISFKAGDTLVPGPFPFTLPSIPGIVPFNADVLSITLESIDNLPAGLSWQCDSTANGCVYDPDISQQGCLRICGDIDCEAVSDSLVLTFDYEIRLPQSVVQQFMGIVPEIINLPFTFNVFLNVEPSSPLVLDVTSNKPQTIGSGESVTLSATPGFAGYQWSDGSTADTLADAPTESTTYSVTATDENGCEQESTYDVTVLTTGVPSPAGTHGISIYPNPANNKFYIDFTDVKVVETLNLSIFDGCGKRVYQAQLDPGFHDVRSFDAASWSPGIYLVNLNGSSVNLKHKLLIH